MAILTWLPGKTVVMDAMDVAPSDIPKEEQAQCLFVAKKKDTSAAGGLST